MSRGVWGGGIVAGLVRVLRGWLYVGLLSPYRIYQGLTEMSARAPTETLQSVWNDTFATKFGQGMKLEIKASMDLKTGRESWEYKVVSPCNGTWVRGQMMEWLVKWISVSNWPRADTVIFFVACPVSYG